MCIEREAVTIVEALVIWQGIVKVGELWDKKKELNTE